jgi:hypothetical protein
MVRNTGVLAADEIGRRRNSSYTFPSHKHYHAVVSSTLFTPPKSTRCPASHRSKLYCIASQLSAERPSTIDQRSAISGLTPLEPLRIRFKVNGATPSFAASSRPLNVIGIQVHLSDELAKVRGGCAWSSVTILSVQTRDVSAAKPESQSPVAVDPDGPTGLARSPGSQF